MTSASTLARRRSGCRSHQTAAKWTSTIHCRAAFSSAAHSMFLRCAGDRTKTHANTNASGNDRVTRTASTVINTIPAQNPSRMMLFAATIGPAMSAIGRVRTRFVRPYDWVAILIANGAATRPDHSGSPTRQVAAKCQTFQTFWPRSGLTVRSGVVITPSPNESATGQVMTIVQHRAATQTRTHCQRG